MVTTTEAADRLRKAMAEREKPSSKGLPSNYEKELEAESRAQADRELQREFDRVERERRETERQRKEAEEAREKAARAEQEKTLKEERDAKARSDKLARDIAATNKEIRRKEEAREESRKAELIRELNRKDREREAEEKKEREYREETAKKEKAEAEKKEADIFRKQQDVADALRKKLAGDEDRKEQRVSEKQKKLDDIREELRRASQDDSAAGYSRRAKLRQKFEDEQRKDPGKININIRKNLSVASIKESVGRGAAKLPGALDRFAVGAFGGAAGSLVTPRTTSESLRDFKRESRSVSAAVRNRSLGKNPFKSVIGVGGMVSYVYQTDGHGRSGRRATLEWRRNHRQYASEERRRSAGVNTNWVNNIMGAAPTPVRQRKSAVKARKRNALGNFMRLI